MSNYRNIECQNCSCDKDLRKKHKYAHTKEVSWNVVPSCYSLSSVTMATIKFWCCCRYTSGTIRESGGAFGKREAAFEGKYFRDIQVKQLEELKQSHEVEIEFHKKEIARHQVRRIISLYCQQGSRCTDCPYNKSKKWHCVIRTPIWRPK